MTSYTGVATIPHKSEKLAKSIDAYVCKKKLKENELYIADLYIFMASNVKAGLSNCSVASDCR